MYITYITHRCHSISLTRFKVFVPTFHPSWPIATCTMVPELRQRAVQMVTGSRPCFFIFLAGGKFRGGFTPTVRGNGSCFKCSSTAPTGTVSIACSFTDKIMVPGG